uniref:Uncharacterized protein n=1 Tax=Glossina palpalis gambiensis TaxID=67801 RepID=A0A1B0BZM5_9MUSC
MSEQLSVGSKIAQIVCFLSLHANIFDQEIVINNSKIAVLQYYNLVRCCFCFCRQLGIQTQSCLNAASTPKMCFRINNAKSCRQRKTHNRSYAFQ